MKKIFNLMVAITLVGVLTECKKGEDDPFLSLRRRKARVAGDWVLKAGTETTSYSSGSTSSSTSYAYTESAYTYNYSYTNGGSTNSSSGAGIYSFKLETDKDGSFTKTEVQGTSTVIETGVWNFSAGVGEKKNKSQLVLTVRNRTTINGGTSSVQTYTGKDVDQVYDIKELRNKRMVLVSEYTYSETGDNGSGTTTWELEQ
jgi:hypothetical protein